MAVRRRPPRIAATSDSGGLIYAPNTQKVRIALAQLSWQDDDDDTHVKNEAWTSIPSGLH
jgi:hypothetical protein